jgi:hypothetical protein
MLQVVPEDRISIPEVFKHPWLKMATNDPYGFPMTEENNEDMEVGFSFRRD